MHRWDEKNKPWRLVKRNPPNNEIEDMHICLPHMYKQTHILLKYLKKREKNTISRHEKQQQKDHKRNKWGLH